MVDAAGRQTTKNDRPPHVWLCTKCRNSRNRLESRLQAGLPAPRSRFIPDFQPFIGMFPASSNPGRAWP